MLSYVFVPAIWQRFLLTFFTCTFQFVLLRAVCVLFFLFWLIQCRWTPFNRRRGRKKRNKRRCPCLFVSESRKQKQSLLWRHAFQILAFLSFTYTLCPFPLHVCTMNSAHAEPSEKYACGIYSNMISDTFWM